ncbi:calcium-binding protein [Poseidonocella sp. HB161398]|uniref:calcium-binding protein n=1 Tax=Poseidonocella sp. HB161398 TaxID=2320855 RepID=UPI001108C818|nr:calcium-binding protein [Poseidonocella sp. HB161398]
MLPGTNVTLEIFSPNLSNPIASTGVAEISSLAVEFNDTEYYDLNGDPYYVVPAILDIRGSFIDYRVKTSGTFANVPDDGFNGYKLSFDGLGGDSGVTIRGVRLLGDFNSLDVPEENLSFTATSAMLNVDGLGYATGEGVSAVVDFKIEGTDGWDVRSGGEGNDKLLGRQGRDILTGGEGDDTLVGGMGMDTLDGGPGNDRLIGGYGPDTFVMSAGSGRSQVMDFTEGDRILVQTGAEELADLEISARNGKVVIEDGDDVFILEGTALSDIDESDFVFSF